MYWKAKIMYFISPWYIIPTAVQVQHGFNCLSCLLSTCLEKNVSDVMQDKGHNTANSPIFEIMSLGIPAFKSHKNIKSELFNI